MHPSITAVALALTIVFATVGTILRIEAPPEPAREPSAASSPTRALALDASLRRLYVRAERGLEHLAGRSPAD